MKTDLTASYLRSLPKDELAKVLAKLTPAQAEEILYTWELWARDNQLEPLEIKNGEKDYWIFNAGRGSGKTRAGAEWVRHRIKAGDRRIACVAPTNSDIRRVMVEGDSGLLSVCWKKDKTYQGRVMGYPLWSPTNRTLTWENGAKAEFYSAEDPERLRGPQFHSAWVDELAAWNNMRMVWDMLNFCVRLGRHNKFLVTTTPKPVKLMRELLTNSRSVVSSGSTYDNKDNLSPSFIKSMQDTYEGTRLGRQELYAEILNEAAGALWSGEMLDKAQVKEKDLPETFERIVVAVDPAITANEESDMTGIMVCARDINGIAYVLEDATNQYTPAEWAAKVGELFYKYEADRVVAEKNQGGDMVRHTLETENPNLPIRLVSASRGKKARAEPVSALYEQGRVKHVEAKLQALEQQMVTWEPLGSTGSPDRLDAAVWGLTELMLGGIAKPQLRLVASNAEELQTAGT